MPDFPPYTRVDAVSWIRKAVAEGPQVLEWLVRHRTGKLFWIEVNLKPAVIGGKNLVLAIVRDITERKRGRAGAQGHEGLPQDRLQQRL